MQPADIIRLHMTICQLQRQNAELMLELYRRDLAAAQAQEAALAPEGGNADG